MAEKFNFREFLLNNGFSYSNTGAKQYFHISHQGKTKEHPADPDSYPKTEAQAKKWIKSFLEKE